MKKLSILCAVLLLAACQAVDINEVGYGEYPANYEEIIKNYYQVAAKDPDSLKFKLISEPKQMYRKRQILSGGTPPAGYVVCTVVNGKNSFGAYTGYQTTGFMIRNGKIIEVYPNGRFMDTWLCE